MKLITNSVPWSTLTCEDCGRDFRAKYKDAIRCVPCDERRNQERRNQPKPKPKSKSKPRQKIQKTKLCVVCQQPFVSTNRKTCSDACYKTLRSKDAIHQQPQICSNPNCQKEQCIFFASFRQKYCSIACSNSGRRLNNADS